MQFSTSQTVTLLSYNLRLHKAFNELPALTAHYNVDVLCLQECRSQGLPATIGELELIRADVMYKSLGLATYVNTDRWQVAQSAVFSLHDTIYERVTRQADQLRLQLLKLSCATQSDVQMVVGNVHIVNLLSSAWGRRQQAARAAELARQFAGSVPVSVVGDFNHPFAELKLLGVMQRAGLEHVANHHGSTSTYAHWPRRVFDRLFVHSVRVDSLIVLPFGASDHAPIIGRFSPAV